MLRKKTLLIAISILFFVGSQAQAPVKDSGNHVIMPASDDYYKSNFYQFLWGKHYRKEWHTPITIPKTMLDTMKGGLHIYQTGGGRQTKSLRVRDNNKREYVFRSVDKTFGKALPEIALGTFLEDIANDQVTFAHPYAALIVAPLAEAAGIYHANPRLYYVPEQPALGVYNDSMGNAAYLFEQRPDENWSTAPNFGNAKNIVGTDKMLEKILKDNDNFVDQKAFARARLFDMFIGDWGRHDDQWRWAEFEDGKKTTYVPVPRDRDNAFSKMDGFLLGMALKAAHAKHMQTFDYKMANIERFNFTARNMDRHLMTELTLADWMAEARELKNRMTDEVIDHAVLQLPATVYPISGPEIAAQLKSRREEIEKYADVYYHYISYEVEVTGSQDDERFEVKRLTDTTTQLNIYKITNDGDVKKKPYYSRIFNIHETKELRVFGIDGHDEYDISGDVNKSVKLRLIGGPGKDKYKDVSKIKKNGRRTIIYDTYGNDIEKSGETQTHLSRDTAITRYEYEYFRPNKNKLKPLLFYSNEDRIYVGYSYMFQKQQWRKYPYGMEHYIDVKYSLTQKAFSSTYAGRFNQLIGNWDLLLDGNYDQERWKNFYGLGNETVETTTDQDFNRVRSREFLGSIGIQRVFNGKHRISIGPYFQSYKVIQDTGRYLAKSSTVQNSHTYENKYFLGATAFYIYQDLNDSILPTRGFHFLANVNYSQNTKVKDNQVTRYGAEAQVYLPLVSKFSLSVLGGATTLSGSPEFFQYNTVGTTQTIRGHQRDRYYGTSTVYNQNELRWITDVRSHLFNGKIGLYGLYDVGRAYLDGETSNKWHGSYGAGFILSPFNLLSANVSYAVSEDDQRFHLSLIKAL